LLAADHAVLLKRIVKGVRPVDGDAGIVHGEALCKTTGSGLHVHVSIADSSGANRFGLEDGETLLQQAVAGMQSMNVDSVGLCAPNFNSYRATWGRSCPTPVIGDTTTRAVAFRVPPGSRFGPPDRASSGGAADASPHLVIAAILAALLHGLTQN